MRALEEAGDGGRKPEGLPHPCQLGEVQLARARGLFSRIELELDLNERMPREEVRPREPARGLQIPQSSLSLAMRTPRSSWMTVAPSSMTSPTATEEPRAAGTAACEGAGGGVEPS